MGIQSEITDFEAEFDEKIIEIAAVADSRGFGASRSQGKQCWTAMLGVTAWQVIGSQEVYEEKLKIFKLVKNTDKLRKTWKKDAIIRAKVRRSEKGFLLVKLSHAKGKFPELKRILKKQLEPVYYTDSILGKFELDRSINYFEKTVKWNDKEVRLGFDSDEEDAMKDAMNTAHELMESQEKWNQEILHYAAQELLDTGIDWQDGEGEELTIESFVERIEIESIDVMPEGGYSCWIDDGDIFFGHVICVSGDIHSGPNDAGFHG